MPRVPATTIATSRLRSSRYAGMATSSERRRSLDRQPVHDARQLGWRVGRRVDDGGIVPRHNVALPPLVTQHPLRPGRPLAQAAQPRNALLLPPSLDPDRPPVVEIASLAAGAGVGPPK